MKIDAEKDLSSPSSEVNGSLPGGGKRERTRYARYAKATVHKELPTSGTEASVSSRMMEAREDTRRCTMGAGHASDHARNDESLT
jgi:hypothetical protein